MKQAMEATSLQSTCSLAQMFQVTGPSDPCQNPQQRPEDRLVTITMTTRCAVQMSADVNGRMTNNQTTFALTGFLLTISRPLEFSPRERPTGTDRKSCNNTSSSWFIRTRRQTFRNPTYYGSIYLQFRLINGVMIDLIIIGEKTLHHNTPEINVNVKK